ncbi:uncharacterized protein A1O9_11701 [Exophiala aquamarina CBS 119918]|uniref:Major facilitator superfamily (MFS) profile domain-containing protein n=1 Tax=Exophiala aquamarina CBS 119918 TaxID=1182545 RepID=A0A072P906_9EURO|nr:uncharacterized protein A1O9_11701 [Exophiala aquamarina CBS 119918]KEF52075.1 hypothetical protein A1O9_11701 [Exophiala aquamarina CBS 119918]
MSGIIGANNVFGRQFGHPDANMQGIIVSIYDIGCAAGCLAAFMWGEHFGRKRMLLAGGSIMIIGTIILGSSYHTSQFLVGRIVTGFGNGINSSTAPPYQSEMANPKNRGALVCAQSMLTIVGLCIAYWLDYGLSFVDSSIQWRFPISFQALFAICLVIQMLPLPESPRWLIEKGRNNEAATVLARLQVVQPATEQDEHVVLLCKQIETSIELEAAATGGFKYSELLSGGKLQNLRRMVLASAVNIMQQFTGANMINYYAPVVYQNAMHLSRNLSLILGGCTSLTYLAASFIPLWTVDKFGRRSLLMISASGLSFCFMMAAILLSTGTGSAAYAATAFIFIFQIFLGIGFLPIPWLYPSEVTTTRIRSRGQAFSGFMNWMCVFTVVQITPIAIDNIAWRTFIIFAIFNAGWYVKPRYMRAAIKFYVRVPIVYCFFPETKGLQLEDIDHLFDKGGITGGVFSSRGHTIHPGFYAAQQNVTSIEKPLGEKETTGTELV